MSESSPTAAMTPVHEAYFNPEEACQPSRTVIRALSTVSATAPTDVSPLYRYLEPEALDMLFSHTARTDTASRATLELLIETWVVVIHSTGRVVVYDGSDGYNEGGGETEPTVAVGRCGDDSIAE